MEIANSALLIVDIQVGAFNGEKIRPLDHSEKLLSNVRSLQGLFRERGCPIIFIQDCGVEGGAFEKGTHNWEFHPQIAPLPGERVIEKNSPSAFQGTDLEVELRRMGVRTVAICGLHSEHCFANTSLAAIELGLNVMVIEDAHSTSRNHPAEASAVIEEQNRLLESRGAVIVKTADLLDSRTRIKTERLLIRGFEERDFESLLLLMTDAETMKYTGFREPQSIEKVRQLLSKWKEEGHGELGVWAVECSESGDFVGWVMLKMTNEDSPELGYMILKSKCGHGYATEIARGILRYASDSLARPRVVAATSPENVASIKVLEKVGMVKVEGAIHENGGIYYEAIFK